MSELTQSQENIGRYIYQSQQTLYVGMALISLNKCSGSELLTGQTHKIGVTQNWGHVRQPFLAKRLVAICAYLHRVSFANGNDLYMAKIIASSQLQTEKRACTHPLFQTEQAPTQQTDRQTDRNRQMHVPTHPHVGFGQLWPNNIFHLNATLRIE